MTIREQQLAAIIEVSTRVARRMGCVVALDPAKVTQFLAPLQLEDSRK